MKSTLFFTLVSLLSIMAANVQAECYPKPHSKECDSDKYCSNPGANGVCKPKLKGGEKADKDWMCFVNFRKDGRCGCTTQTGNNGCKDGMDCHTQKKRCGWWFKK